MDLQTLRNYAEEQGYALVDVRSNEPRDEEIMNIACMSTGIPLEEFHVRSSQKHTFARYLAGYYWFTNGHKDVYEVADKLGIDYTVVHYIKRIMRDETKYFKPWQQRAIHLFNDATNSIKTYVHEG